MAAVRYPDKVGCWPDKMTAVRYPDKIGCRPDRMAAVRYSDKVGCWPDRMVAMRHPDKVERWPDPDVRYPSGMSENSPSGWNELCRASQGGVCVGKGERATRQSLGRIPQKLYK